MAIPMSVSVPGAVSITNVPLAPTWAVYQTSPLLFGPSHVSSAIEELVAAVLSPNIPEQVIPSVNGIALQGSSFMANVVDEIEEASMDWELGIATANL